VTLHACRALALTPLPLHAGYYTSPLFPLSESSCGAWLRVVARGSSWELVGARGSSWELVGARGKKEAEYVRLS